MKLRFWVKKSTKLERLRKIERRVLGELNVLRDNLPYCVKTKKKYSRQYAHWRRVVAWWPKAIKDKEEVLAYVRDIIKQVEEKQLTQTK